LLHCKKKYNAFSKMATTNLECVDWLVFHRLHF
jgi:hypothetical protein